MSHFVGIVAGDDIREQLLPHYYENTDDDKWDWYVPGGRWSGFLILKPEGERCGEVANGKASTFNPPNSDPRYADYALKCDVDWGAMKADNRTPFCFVQNSKWMEIGEMGGWGQVSNEKELKKWEAEFAEWVDDLPDNIQLTVVDFHI